MPPLPRPFIVLSILALVLAACARADLAPAGRMPAPASAAASAWLADVQAMADADAGAGRRDAIRQRLDVLGIEWRSAPFEIESERGENILADVAGAAQAPVLLLGAHSDRVGAGQGATDNASGSATVLALAERFRLRPLQHHRVAIAFWDLEERGLLGARAHVAQGGVPPALYVNFDVFGWGDTLWMMTPPGSEAIVAASRSATAGTSVGFSGTRQFPPTDHRAFLQAGWPAVAYALLDNHEIKLVLDTYSGIKTATVPKVMQVIHSAHDTTAQIDANAASRGVDVVEDALRRWDAAADATVAR